MIKQHCGAAAAGLVLLTPAQVLLVGPISSLTLPGATRPASKISLPLPILGLDCSAGGNGEGRGSGLFSTSKQEEGFGPPERVLVPLLGAVSLSQHAGLLKAWLSSCKTPLGFPGSFSHTSCYFHFQASALPCLTYRLFQEYLLNGNFQPGKHFTFKYVHCWPTSEDFFF